MASNPPNKRQKKESNTSQFVPVGSAEAKKNEATMERLRKQVKNDGSSWTVLTPATLQAESGPPSTAPPSRVSAQARPKRKRVNSVSVNEKLAPAPIPPPHAYSRPTVPLPPHPAQSSASVAHSGQVPATHAMPVSIPRRQSAYSNNGTEPRMPTYEQPTQPPTMPHLLRGSSHAHHLQQSVDAPVPLVSTHRQPAQQHLLPCSRYPIVNPNGAEEVSAAAAEGAGTYGYNAPVPRASTYGPTSYAPPQSHGSSTFQFPQNYETPALQSPQSFEAATFQSPQIYEPPALQSPRELSSYGSSAFQPPHDDEPSFQPPQGDSFDGHLPLTNGTDSSDATATAPHRIQGRVDTALPPVSAQGQVAQPHIVPNSPGAVSTYSLSDADAEGDPDPEFDEEDDRSTAPVQAHQPGEEENENDMWEMYTHLGDNLKSGAPESVKPDYPSTSSQVLTPTMDVATFVSQKERSEANDEGCGQELLSGAEDIGDATATTSEESPEFSTSSSRSTPARDVVTYAHSACPDSSAFPMRNDTDEDAPRASSTFDNGMDPLKNLLRSVDKATNVTNVYMWLHPSTKVTTPEPANVDENGAIDNDREWNKFSNSVTGDFSEWDEELNEHGGLFSVDESIRASS